jgi:hypothetical protein
MIDQHRDEHQLVQFHHAIDDDELLTLLPIEFYFEISVDEPIYI